MCNFKPLAIFDGCTAWFVSDMVGNPEDRFSHDTAQLKWLFYDNLLIILFISATKHKLWVLTRRASVRGF